MFQAYKNKLLLSTALFGALAASQALAQAPAAQPPTQALEEVVVTATRQADTVNRVSLSVAAVTQKSLDAQGVKQAVDIVRLVPGLSIAAGNSTPGIGTFAIAWASELGARVLTTAGSDA